MPSPTEIKEGKVPKGLVETLAYAEENKTAPMDVENVIPIADKQVVNAENLIPKQYVEPDIGTSETDLTDYAAGATEYKEPELEGEEITAEDIRDSYNLQKAGALEGDRYTSDGTLIRVVSDEPKGEVLTAYDIENSKNLQDAGAEPGDQYVVTEEGGELLKSGANDALRNFQYFYKKGTAPIQEFSTWLEAKFPFPKVYLDETTGTAQTKTPEEYYGIDNFSQLPEEERRKIIIDKTNREIDAEFDDFLPREDTGSGLAGQVLGELDATDVFLGKKVITGATALGAIHETTESLYEKGKVEPFETIKGSLYGFGGSTTLVGGGKLVKKGYEKATTTTKKSNKILNDVERIAAREVATGSTPIDAVKLAKEELGLSDAKFAVIMNKAGRKPNIPTTQARAEKIIEDELALDSAIAKGKSGVISKLFVSIHDRVKDISPAIAGRLRKFEARLHINTAQKLKRVEPFIKMLKEMKSPEFNKYLANGEWKAAKGIMKSRGYNTQILDDVIDLLKTTHKELQEAGRENLGEIVNYFPRLVKDLGGLKNALGSKERSRLNKALEEVAKSRNKSVSKLTIEEEAEAIDKFMRGVSYFKKGGPRYTKKRQLERLDDRLLQYYHNPEEALAMYIRNTVSDIERRKFFGQASKNTDQGLFNVEDSIGNYIARESRKLGDKDADILESLLNARFSGGEESMGKLFGGLRDAGYATTIANPISAITQIGDLANSGALFGLRNTIKALFGKKNIKAVDLGIQRTITEDLVDPNWTSNALNKLFKLSGFNFVDRLGKETTINAALLKFQKLAKTSKGREQLRRKYGEAFGDEMDTIISDLQKGDLTTPRIKELAFSVISDVQPISRIEQPQLFNAHPTARLAYMLKSFTIKQWGVARNNVLKEWQQGNKATAVKNATLLASYLTVANTGAQIVKDFFMGRDVDPASIPDRAVWALLGVYGGNKYQMERFAQRGDIAGLVVNLIKPPALDMLNLPSKAYKEFQDDERAKTSIRSIPIVGPILYSWFGGGMEAYNERQKKD